MMVLPDFHLMKPHDLTETLRSLAEHPGALPFAGGTDLLVSMKQGLFHPTHLVDLKGVAELTRTEITDDGAWLGACLRLSEVRDHPEVRRCYPALSQAAGLVASPPLQNRGTLGGNICLDTRCWYYNQSAFWRQSRGYCLKRTGDVCQAAPGSKRCYATCSADTVPALIALHARVTLARWHEGAAIRRELPLEDLYVEDGIRRNVLNPGEVVVGLRLPRSHGLRSGFRKYRQRASIDYPLVSVAAAFRVEQGSLRDVRVVIGALASAPVLAKETMAVLEGASVSPAVLERAAELVTKGTRPVRNQAGSPAHRRHMARVLCRRLLEDMANTPAIIFIKPTLPSDIPTS
jgi:4-hydroxybenzoyl-CoA reductase subunit beta